MLLIMSVCLTAALCFRLVRGTSRGCFSCIWSYFSYMALALTLTAHRSIATGWPLSNVKETYELPTTALFLHCLNAFANPLYLMIGLPLVVLRGHD